MNFQANWTDVQGEAAQAVPSDKKARRADVEVFHEGGHVRIRLNRMSRDKTLMIPLRNGFPLYAADRAAQCFSVIDGLGRRVALAIRLPDYGLRLTFDGSPAAGDYLIRTQTTFGRA